MYPKQEGAWEDTESNLMFNTRVTIDLKEMSEK